MQEDRLASAALLTEWKQPADTRRVSVTVAASAVDTQLPRGWNRTTLASSPTVTPAAVADRSRLARCQNNRPLPARSLPQLGSPAIVTNT